MIKNVNILFVFIFFSSSCCLGNEECLGPPLDIFGTFKFVNDSNKQDILFGSNKIYDPRQLKFYSIEKNDTIFFKNTIQVRESSSDSLVEVIFFPKVNSPVFIAFSENEIDTLLVSYQIEERECCYDIEKIIKYQYNQVDYNVINSQVTSFIKK